MKVRGQNFGQVQNAFIRVVNDQSNTEIVRFDLNEDYSTETAMILVNYIATMVNGSLEL